MRADRVRSGLQCVRYNRATKTSVIAREAEVRAGEVLKAMDLKRAGLKGTRREAGPGRGRKTVGETESTVSPLAALGIKPAACKRGGRSDPYFTRQFTRLPRRIKTLLRNAFDVRTLNASWQRMGAST